MSKRIFVGNLAYSTTKESLAEIFGAFGTVTDTHVVTDRETQRPRGFAFVEMEDAEAADKAIEAINGTEIDGREVKVNEAQPREENRNRSFNTGRRDDNRSFTTRNDRGGYGQTY